MGGSKLVWTSDPDEAKRLRESGQSTPQRDDEPSGQIIRVIVDRKRRAGRSVTVASGFTHSAAVIGDLTRQLKKRCGAGGTVRDSEIEIQGEHLGTVIAELEKRGYRVRS